MSARSRLAFDGRSDLSSATAQRGLLLLDPLNVWIGVDTANDTALPVIAASQDPTSTWFVSAAAVASALASSDVSISAVDSIFVVSPISAAATYALTLSAGATLSIAAAISSLGAISLSAFNVTVDDTVSGSAVSVVATTLAVSHDITATNGDLSLTGSLFAQSSVTLAATGAVSFLPFNASTTLSAFAPLSWSAGNGISIQAPLAISGSGSVFLDSDSDVDGAGTFTVATACDIAASAAVTSVTVLAADLQLASNFDAGAAAFTIQPSFVTSATLRLGTAVVSAFHISQTELDHILTHGLCYFCVNAHCAVRRSSIRRCVD